jgi:hypothetical protein
MINIQIQKKDLWLLAAIMIVLIGAGYVIAYGSGQPTVHGHDAGEIEGSGGISFLGTPIQILDETGTKGGATSSGAMSTGLTIDLGSIIPAGSANVLLTISSSFTSDDDRRARQQFFAWSSLPSIPSIDINSPYLVLNLEAGKIIQGGGEGDWDYAGESNTFSIPITNNRFEIMERYQNIFSSKDYSLILLGYS